MGRPTKFNDVTAQRIVAALRQGATYRLAALAGGISTDSLARWKKKHTDFAQRCQQAEADAALRWLDQIDQAAERDWRAAAWKLERRFPSEYGKERKTDDLAGETTFRVKFPGMKDDEPIQLKLNVPTPNTI